MGRADSEQNGYRPQGSSKLTGSSAHPQGAAGAQPLHWAGAAPLADRAEHS